MTLSLFSTHTNRIHNWQLKVAYYWCTGKFDLFQKYLIAVCALRPFRKNETVNEKWEISISFADPIRKIVFILSVRIYIFYSWESKFWVYWFFFSHHVQLAESRSEKKLTLKTNSQKFASESSFSMIQSVFRLVGRHMSVAALFRNR